MAREYTRMKKVFCDFCNAEITESTPTVKKEAVEYVGKEIGIEIKLSSPDKRRFQHDICEGCVFKAVASAHQRFLARDPFAETTEDKEKRLNVRESTTFTG